MPERSCHCYRHMHSCYVSLGCMACTSCSTRDFLPLWLRGHLEHGKDCESSATYSNVMCRGGQVPMMTRSLLPDAMDRSPAARHVQRTQTSPCTQNHPSNPHHQHLTAAQMHASASEMEPRAVDDVGYQERGISLRDGIVLGSQDEGGMPGQAPAMQLPFMLDRFIYDT